MARGRGRKGTVMEVKRSDILDDLDTILSGVGASIAGEDAAVEVSDSDVLEIFESSDGVRPSELGGTLDIASSVALAEADVDFVEPESSMLEGDADDPFDVRSFRTCMNGGCDFKAGCLRWRLRKQRSEYSTEAMFFADQDGCLVRADQHMSRFVLDPIEDW